MTRTAGTRERPFTAYLTAYSYWDNTPPGSAAIARPILHRKAGGTGTYKDPVTIAVGHRKSGGHHMMDYPAGTRFYLPKLRKYAIVRRPLRRPGHGRRTGPCHTGHKGYPWLDIYIGGRRAGKTRLRPVPIGLTGVQGIIMNPRPGYPLPAARSRKAAANGSRSEPAASAARPYPDGFPSRYGTGSAAFQLDGVIPSASPCPEAGREIMQIIKAAVCREFGAPLVIEDVQLAPPGMGEVEVTLDAVAICHSDISYAEGAWGGHLPAVYGHEAAGVVTDLGEGVLGFH